jgi:hypothetical protein
MTGVSHVKLDASLNMVTEEAEGSHLLTQTPAVCLVALVAPGGGD